MSRAAVALLTLTCAATAFGLRPRLFAALDATVAIEDVYYLPADNRVTRLLTVGYTEAGADLLWMKALLYYTENLGSRGEAQYALNYAEALVALDPDFAEAYHWAGMLPFYLSVESTPEVRRRGTEFLIRGAERMPAPAQTAPAKPCWRQASKTVTATALDRFKLRCPGSIGRRRH